MKVSIITQHKYELSFYSLNILFFFFFQHDPILLYNKHVPKHITVMETKCFISLSLLVSHARICSCQGRRFIVISKIQLQSSPKTRSGVKAMDFFEAFEVALEKTQPESTAFVPNENTAVMSNEMIFTRSVIAKADREKHKYSPSKQIASLYTPTIQKYGIMPIKTYKHYVPPNDPKYDHIVTPLDPYSKWKPQDVKDAMKKIKPYKYVQHMPREKTKKRTIEEIETLKSSPVLTSLELDEITPNLESSSNKCKLDHTSSSSLIPSEDDYPKKVLNCRWEPLDLFVHQRPHPLCKETMPIQAPNYNGYPNAPNVVHSPRAKRKAKRKPGLVSEGEGVKMAESARRYMQCVEGSVDECFIAPLQPAWLTQATCYVGAFSRYMVTPSAYHDTMLTTAADINRVYKLSMRKAIVDYVLEDDEQRKSLQLEGIEDIMQPISTGFVRGDNVVLILPQWWRDAVAHSSNALSRIMFRLVPISLEMESMWSKNYGNQLMIDIETPEIYDQMPLDLRWFVAHQKKLANDKREIILRRWIPWLANKFVYSIPLNMGEKGFHEAMARQLANQIRRLVEESIVSMVRFITLYKFEPKPISTAKDKEPKPVQKEFFYGYKPEVIKRLFGFVPTIKEGAYSSKDHNSPPFYLHLKNDKGLFSVEPSWEEIEDELVGIIDHVVLQSGDIVRVDHGKIEPSRATLPHITLDDEIVVVAKDIIKQVVQSNISGPQKIMHGYREFLDLFQLDVNQYIKEFGMLEQPLSGYTEQVDEFHGRALSAEAHSLNVIDCTLVRCIVTDFKQSFIDHATCICTRLKTQVLEIMNKSNKEIFNRYNNMADFLARDPTNTEEATSLKKFWSATLNDMALLERMSQENKIKEEWLEGVRFPIPDIDFSVIVANMEWPKRIRTILNVHQKRIQDEYDYYEQEFKKKRNDFQKLLNSYEDQIKEFDMYGDIEKAPMLGKEIRMISEGLASANEVSDNINGEELLFGMPLSKFPQIQVLLLAVVPYFQLWSIADTFKESEEHWMTAKLNSLDSEKIENEVFNWYRVVFKLVRTFEEKLPDPCKVATILKANLDRFKETLPLFRCLCNPGLRPRHFAKISEVVGFEVKNDDATHFRQLLRLNVHEHIFRLEEISEFASKEYALERGLASMENDWLPLTFEFLLYKNTGCNILKGGPIEEAQLLLDEHIVKTQNMLASPFAAPFEEHLTKWLKSLVLLQKLLVEWLQAQASWMYLEPIFGSPDIIEQMPKEGSLFHATNTIFCKLMKDAESFKQMMDACELPNILDILVGCNESLDVVQKGLNHYLETKRLAFPRFFFLSNDELLEILSETKDPLRVQPFLKKCFEGINALTFQENLDITHMWSVEKEVVEFTRSTNPKAAKGNVERWLIEVERMMRETLKVVVQKAVADYAIKERGQWILIWPGMIVLCGSQMYWTSELEEEVDVDGVKGLARYEAKCTAQLQELVQLVRGDLTNMERLTIGALVTIDVHARDVVTLLVELGIDNKLDFDWLSQLRYALEDGNCLVKMVNACRNYGYEYLGNSSRLVITPLTDRCYRTLMGALHLNLGGAPEGPAGTGKTETTKDLAKALAMQCVVFNCSDGLDYLAMGKFFKGLAASGAWACFDEFNRIDVEVLSVIAQQILTIQRAIMEKVSHFMFEGTYLPLIPTCTSFITMNPGYAGRAELPDNLKALFRTVAMMVPNYAMIGEITLYSFGYLEARDMARKLVATYKLCSEQLSSQDHYDYGMRAVIAVLRAAGNLKRRYRDDDESVLVLRAIRDVNLPKFLSHDIPMFEGIMSDLFPGVKLPPPDYVNVMVMINRECIKYNYQNGEVFLKKILELYEMIIVRHGLMLVGYSFGAKTAAYKVLADALGGLFSEGLNNENITRYDVLNPKSVTMGQLYGQFDPVSHEWTDGILAVTFRNMSVDTTPTRQWLLFDGPVDAIWIENMNTVLDDNKKLCLMSGEIIQMTNHMNLIFEVQDLAAASPATVSRCGMIYMEPVAMGWRCILLSWLQSLPQLLQDPYRTQIQKLAEWLLPPALRCVQKNCKMTIPMQEQNMITSLLRLMMALMEPELTDKSKADLYDEKAKVAWVDCIFLFSMVWTIGACTDMHERPKFDTLLKKMLVNMPPSEYMQWIETPARKVSTPFPDGKSVYDVMFNKMKGKWGLWTDLVDETMVPLDAHFEKIIVQTPDSAKYTFLMEVLVHHNLPLLFVGPTGTGKSVYVKQYLMKLDTEKWQSIFFNFSAQTSANQTQDIIDGKLIKRKPGIFGPQKGKQCVIFVDDLNMPAIEKYGAQPPIELLRQWMDHQGWYDRYELVFRNIIDIQFVSAMSPPGGGRNSVTNRYLRHFNVVCVNAFSDLTMNRIFLYLVDFWMKRARYNPTITKLRSAMVTATIDIYQTVQAELLPTPEKSHYTYNLRDISKIFLGLQYAPTEIGDDYYKIIRLWANECLRVFYDRLINDSDRMWFCNLVGDMVEKHFKERFSKVYATFVHSEVKRTDLTPALLQYHIAGDFMVPGAEPALYNEIPDETLLLKVMKGYLEDYNEMTNNPMNLVLFQFAIQHVSRICRVIKQPRGNVLLVGVGGSGRQSLARLAAFIQGFEVFQVEISKNFGMAEWRESIGIMLRKAGELDKKTMFLFVDTQIKVEGFVEDINSLLNTGEVPNLYESGDLGAICEGVRPKAKRAKRDGSRMELFSFFVDECAKNLRIALALKSVATRFLADVNVEPKLICELVEMVVFFHMSVQDLAVDYFKTARRYCYVTPTSFLELISSFKVLLDQKQADTLTLKKRYEMGIMKLDQSASDVNAMSLELEGLQPMLLKSSNDVMELLKVIDKETKEANKVKAVVLTEEADANVKAEAASAIKLDTEAELALVMPILESALRALDTLTKNDISELKGMKSPPAGVKLVMEAVCIMKSIKPTRMKDPGGSGKMIEDYWESCKKMLADSDFLKSLKEYNKDDIPPDIILQIRQYLANPAFAPSLIAKISKAAFGLCSWVGAIEAYDRAAKIVAPKVAALRAAEAEYNEVMAQLAIKQANLKVVEEKLGVLGAELQGAQGKKKKVLDEVDFTQTKIDRANQLMAGLGGEKARWMGSAEMFGQMYIKLTGDILLSAGMIAYLGTFTPSFREKIVVEWMRSCKQRKIPCSTNFSLSVVLADPVRIRAWNIAGLPKDQSSIDNGAIVSKCRRWPLMIDPQGQANKWIKNMEGDKLVITKLSDSDFLRKLENAIQFGKPVLLENVGAELDVALEPLLLRQTFKQSGSLCIRLGDSIIEYSDQFRLYITSKLRNPHYSPEISAKVTVLNFMITPEGLIDQLLGIAVAKERPDLEAQKNQLILQGAQNNKMLQEIEDKTLAVLSQEGNILEDETGIQVLSQSKILGEDIQEKQKVAEATEKIIDATRNSYVPVAVTATILYFCVAEMCNIEPMYQYSLPWFVDLFVFSIVHSEKSNVLEERLKILSEHFMYNLYCNICRSLFEKDKILFSFVMAIRLESALGKVDMEEFNFLLTGGIVLEAEPQMPPLQWITKKMWGEFFRLSKFKAFKDLHKGIESNNDTYSKIFDSPMPQEEEWPEPWNSSLSKFQKICLLRCIRPDKIVLAVSSYITEAIGKQFVEPLPLNLEACYKDSGSTVPLVFILSPGSDPMSALLKLAADNGAKLQTVSLGQGQGPVALAILKEAASDGSWVALQNCHFASSWMPAFEKYWEQELTSTDKVQPSFRLWLTSYPSEHFPVAVLQNAVKMTNEPPNGLKANMTGSYLMFPISDADFFQGCSKGPTWRRMLYALCFFHAFVQERRKFGPLGWNILYEFNESDLRISVRQLRMFLEEYPDSVPYKALNYLTGECNYGGRVTDDHDRRTLVTILASFYAPDILNHDFSFSESGLFTAPPDGDYNDFLEFIKKLPAAPQPEVYGFHSNADITKENTEVNRLLASLLLVVPMEDNKKKGKREEEEKERERAAAKDKENEAVSTTKEVKDKTEKEIGPMTSEEVMQSISIDILQKLPNNFDIEQAQIKYPTTYYQSMNTVLCQELERFNKLLTIIRNSLLELQKAVKGFIVMSAELELCGRTLVIGQVPTMWAAKSYPSKKPLASYIADLIERIAFLQSWVTKGAPIVYWLSAFFFTQSFLTGAKQNFARSHKIPIDTVDFEFEIREHPDALTEPPQDGVYVKGLYLEGARYDYTIHELGESLNKILFSKVPIIWMVPGEIKNFKAYPHYLCPLYKTSDRRGILSTTGHSTNFVMEVKLPSSRPQAHWVKRGVAMLTQLDT
ncbi:uncharacterized protein [Physcomitrium patens]|uniref:uncharacterized protein isoform X3 n=1 Tax=Physcomitrium patens TaxID=3218 RepID=UPI003CCD17F6